MAERLWFKIVILMLPLSLISCGGNRQVKKLRALQKRYELKMKESLTEPQETVSVSEPQETISVTKPETDTKIPEKSVQTETPKPQPVRTTPTYQPKGIPHEIKIGKEYFKAGKYSEALEQYELFLHKAPANTPYVDEALLMASVSCDWIAKKVKDSYFIKKERDYLLKLINEHKQSIRKAEAHLYLGQAYGGFTGVKLTSAEIKYQNAIKHFETAYRESEQKWIKPKALLRLGQTYQKTALYLKAKEYYLAVVDIYPKSQAAKEARKAIASLSAEKTAVKINLLKTARELFDAGEYNLALQVFQKEAEKNHGNEKAHYSLMMQGVCYLWLGRLDEAENTLRSACEKYTSAKGDTDFYLGFALEKRGKTAEAIKFYKKAAENPENYGWVVSQSEKRLKYLKTAQNTGKKQKKQ